MKIINNSFQIERTGDPETTGDRNQSQIFLPLDKENLLKLDPLALSFPQITYDRGNPKNPGPIPLCFFYSAILRYQKPSNYRSRQ